MRDPFVSRVCELGVTNPRAMAVADTSRTLTWAELSEAIKRRAQSLPDMTSAALHRPADVSWLIDLLSLWSREIPVLPFSAALPRATVREQAVDLGVSGIVDAPAAVGDRDVEVLATEQTHDAPWTKETSLVHFTSGTTGTASGVPRDHINLVDEAESVATLLGLGEGTPVLCGTPISHSFASGLQLGALLAGAPTLLVPSFDPAAIVHHADTYGAHVLCATPYLLRALLRSRTLKHRALASIKIPMVGGAPLRPNLAEAWREFSGVPVVQEYGLSECGIATINLDEASIAPLSVGRPLPGTKIVVVADDGQIVPAGSTGRVLVTRAGCPATYLTPSGKLVPIPAQDINGTRYVDSGDIGHMDEAGLLHLSDRRKSIINVDGTKVLPRVVENALSECSAVTDAVVVGVPDEFRGEAVAAMVEVAMPVGVGDLALHLRARLSSPMIPRRWLLVDELPRTVSGKPDVAAVRLRLDESGALC
jgi:long-chain acyl-CoA synthetase